MLMITIARLLGANCCLTRRLFSLLPCRAAISRKNPIDTGPMSFRARSAHGLDLITFHMTLSADGAA